MSAQLSIRLLGGLHIELNGETLSGFPSRKAEALLLYLASSDRPQQREFLAEMLWDDRPLSQSLANLRSILSSLRRELNAHLIITRQTIAFDHRSDYWMDTAEFESLLVPMQTLLAGTSPLDDASAAQLSRAASLYEGDFLSGFFLRDSRGFEEWAILQRERLQRLAVVTLSSLVRHQLETGGYHEGLPLCTRLLALDPLNEDAHRQLMLLLARDGQRAAALSQYQTCRDRLAADLSVPPAPATTALFQRIRTAQMTQPADLPRLAPLVGREREMAELTVRLANPDHRLLTLLGPGGIGKTSLALGAARQIAGTRPGMFLHGIRFIPLAGVSDPELLISALAEGVGMVLQGSRPPLEEVLDFLRPKEMLLVLDNLEHLLDDDGEEDAATILYRVLQEAPSVSLLATSQKRLNLRAELLFDLHGLPCPAADAEEPIEAYPAVQMFVQRARWLQRFFEPSPADYQAIARLCRTVDGIPLAIELAAATIRRYSCIEIEARLRHNLDVLSTDLRNVPQRHLSLREVFAYSWGLLSEAEQGAAQALSIFRDPFSAEAAVQVGGASTVVLEGLLDKSFLRQYAGQDRPADGAADDLRFEMHPLLRQYAAEEAARSPALQEKLADAHCAYHARLLEGLVSRTRGPQRTASLAQIGRIIDDVRAAWQWAVSSGRQHDLSQFAAALQDFYWSRSWLQEGLDAFGAAADAVARMADADPLLLARLRARQGSFLRWLARFDEARQILDACLPVLQEHRAWLELAWANEELGGIAYSMGAYAAAREHFEASRRLFLTAEDDAGVAQVLNSLANLISDESGDYHQAAILYKQSLAIYERIGDLAGQSKCIINLGATAQMEGDNDAARAYFLEGIKICRQIDNRIALAIALNNLGRLEAGQGDHEEGEHLLLESLVIKREIGERRAIVFSLKHLGGYHRDRGRYREARACYDEALTISRSLALPPLTADVLNGVARLYAVAGRPERAAEILSQVIKISANDQEIRTTALDLWAEVGRELPPDQLAECSRRGENSPLDTMVVEVLNDTCFGGASPVQELRS